MHPIVLWTVTFSGGTY